jgi:hypothetical protein
MKLSELEGFNDGTVIYNIIATIVQELMEEASTSSNDPAGVPVGTHDLSIHAKLYSIADKYFVKGLKDVARMKFEQCIDDSFASDAFYDAAMVVFVTTPDTDFGLRDIVTKRVSEEKAKYSLRINEKLDKALRDIPGLAYSVLRYEDDRQ